MLGALLPSESCHDEFEALHLQYSYDMAHTFFWLFVSLRGFSLCLKRKTIRLVCYPKYFEG